MTPERAERFLQREVGDPKLRVRWRSDIERFEVGRKLEDGIHWFYVVSTNEEYRPVDMRTVRKLVSLDTWRREKTLTVEEFAQQIAEKKANEKEREREVIRYRIKHEARYIKKAAEKDGIV